MSEYAVIDTPKDCIGQEYCTPYGYDYDGALKAAREIWDHLTLNEKSRRSIMVCIVDSNYPEYGIIYAVLWGDGHFNPPEGYCYTIPS